MGEPGWGGSWFEGQWFTALLQFGAPLRLGAEPVAAGQARQYLARGRCSK